MNAAPGNMWDFFTNVQSGERFPLVVVIIVFGTMALILTVAIVAHTVKSIYRNRLEDALKRELVDRGFSADEIATILAAPAASRHLHSTGNGHEAP
jgi:hypothetical protein